MIHRWMHRGLERTRRGEEDGNGNGNGNGNGKGKGKYLRVKKIL